MVPRPARLHARRLPLLTLVAAVVLTACGDSTGDEQHHSTAGVVPGLERFYEQDVAWEPCDDYGADGAYLARQDVECGYVEVPLDYADPEGEPIRLAVSRLPASGERIGSLLVNPGGPGASGLSTALAADGTALGERFDVVGFDPRGVGASEPAVRCRTDAEFDDDRAQDDGDTSPEGIAATEKRNREYAQLCADRTGTDLLAHIGSREVVQDMDILRGVLGDDALTYLGYSYGTRLGTLYAEAFPGRVRAMVLDGAIDPEQDPVEEIVRQAEGFQKAFDEFAAYCTRYAGCPLGDDPAQAAARFRDLVDPLLEAPAPTTDPRGLSHRDAITGVQQGLYSPTLWGSLRGGLDSLARSGTGDTLLHLADLYEGRGEDGAYTNITDAFNAIRCVDDPPLTDRALAGELDTRFRAVAPFLDDGRGTGAAALDVCAFWPVPATGEPHAPDVRDLPPVLVVSTTGDPATPYAAGVELADRLGGVLLTFEGTQHTVALDGNDCVDNAVTSYLVDLAVPASDPHC